jgi:hypothetical protein
MKKLLKKIFWGIIKRLDSVFKLRATHEIILSQQHILNQKNSKNSFNSYGHKCFSQSDEDGLTLEIIKRLGIENGTFLEFGVGDGTENNSLILISIGWKGCWVGNEKLKININEGKRLKYFKNFVDLENVLQISKNGLNFVESKSYDVISMDLDGNDYYFTKKLLENNLHPKLFIVEYNGKFFPPIRFLQNYDEKHFWKNDDYFGCSLSIYVELFESFGYKLICCNSWTGTNAFFVKEECLNLFPEVPDQIEEIYIPPFYHVRTIGHPITSNKTIESFLME